MKNKKILILIICIVVIIALIASSFGIYFSLLSNVPERNKIEDRSSRFFSHSRTYVVAASPYGTDCIFETYEGLQDYYLKHRHNASAIDIELNLTKDSKVVVFSGDLSAYSNAHILYGNDATIADLTLDELQKVNLAYNLADENGQMFYKAYGNDDQLNLVNILTLEEMIAWFNSQRADLPLFAIRLNDSVKGNESIVIDEVNRVFSSIGYSDFFFILPNNQSTADYIDENYPDMLRSATDSEAKKLFRNCLTNKESTVSYEVVYTDCDEGFFGKFDSEKFINYANNSNIALILRNVDEEAAKNLISLKVDGITTSDPEAFNNLIRAERENAKSETTAD